MAEGRVRCRIPMVCGSSPRFLSSTSVSPTSTAHVVQLGADLLGEAGARFTRFPGLEAGERANAPLDDFFARRLQTL